MAVCQTDRHRCLALLVSSLYLDSGASSRHSSRLIIEGEWEAVELLRPRASIVDNHSHSPTSLDKSERYRRPVPDVSKHLQGRTE